MWYIIVTEREKPSEERKVPRMYEVTTVTKTLATNVDEATAMAIATTAINSFRYVEVKRILSVAPWYAVSVKILTR